MSGRGQRDARRIAAAVIVAGLLSGVGLFAGTDGDSDGDGLSDCAERAGLRATTGEIWRTSAHKADTDGDGIRDGDEAIEFFRPSGFISALKAAWSCDGPTYRALSIPNRSDSDNDGLNDAVELSDGSSVFDVDSDDDGLTDRDERAWGSDPNVVDTDGDGLRDGDDIQAGNSPVLAKERIDRESWIREYQEGVTWGDNRDIDSVAQLLGAMSVSAVSGVPVVGWVIGTIADLRDVAIDLRQREWGSAVATSTGLLPYVGDTAKAAGYVSTFAKRYPGHIRTALTAIAQWDKISLVVRERLIAFGLGSGTVAQLRVHELSDAAIVAMAKKGANLARLARTLNRAGGVVQAEADGARDSSTNPTTVTEAGTALREQVRDQAVPQAVPEHPVYVRTGPMSRPGRLVDACSNCSPRPLAGHSELRFARYGPQYFSATAQSQIDRDAELARAGYTVEWHFFLSNDTDVDPRLLDSLGRGDIPYVVHLPL